MGKSKSSRPKNRAVHFSTSAGRFGTGLGSSGTLGNRALIQKREDAASQRTQAAQGESYLPTKLTKVLTDNEQG